MIGSGKSHIHTLAAVAQAQIRDGLPVPDAIRAFASIGSCGAHSQNEERDLHRWLKDLHGLGLEIYYLPLKLEETWQCTSDSCAYCTRISCDDGFIPS